MNRFAKATIFHNPMCGTSRKTLDILRDAGVDVWIREYLKDPPTRDELIASTHTPAQMGDFLGPDSIGSLSLDGLMAAVGAEEREAAPPGSRPAARSSSVGSFHRRSISSRIR